METLSEMGYSNLDYDEIVFPHLGFDVHVKSTAFSIFGLDVQWYGIMIVIGILLAMTFAYRNMRRVGIDSDRATDAIIGGILGALVGARAYYVIFNWDEYKDDLPSIFNTREGGLAVFGGLIGAVIVGGIICKIRKVKFLPMMDLCGVGFLIGQCLGRWGNFFNQEAFGKNTDSLFCMSGGRVQQWIAMNYNALGSYNEGVTMDAAYAVHPCFLYESAWCLLGTVLLGITLYKWRKFDGQIILMYMIWYGFGRFFIEGLRTDSLTIGSLRVSQALSAAICVASLIILIVMLSKVKRMGREYRLYVDTAESKALLAEADKRIAEETAKKAAKKAAKNPDAKAETIAPEEETPAEKKSEEE
ncbi:MAG: prolipoprotein diacylglyceryl transferase [Oscillospiraceae bacterium]|nr:prolipoprotein diacylglyceryl transferase [Oscillospiraceae bacterium]